MCHFSNNIVFKVHFVFYFILPLVTNASVMYFIVVGILIYPVHLISKTNIYIYI